MKYVAGKVNKIDGKLLSDIALEVMLPLVSAEWMNSGISSQWLAMNGACCKFIASTGVREQLKRFREDIIQRGAFNEAFTMECDTVNEMVACYLLHLGGTSKWFSRLYKEMP